jgi:hypothetical protein
MNCGPAAVAAVLGLTPDELRPHLGDFERKRYTNPTLMWSILRSLKVSFSVSTLAPKWPPYGLARIQWEGPWTQQGVPIAARYRQTHWVGVASGRGGEPVIFDVNAMRVGGWIKLDDWQNTLVPWILSVCVPRANGKWYITHAVHLDRPEAAHG